MTNLINIQLCNKLSEIEKVNEILEGLGETHKLPEKVIKDMCLASEEIITNIISYGYDDKETHFINVRIYFNEDSLITEIEDEAKPFNPVELPDADLSAPVEEKKIGGLGIYLIRKLMDRFEYSRVNEKNILLLGKKIK